MFTSKRYFTVRHIYEKQEHHELTWEDLITGAATVDETPEQISTVTITRATDKVEYPACANAEQKILDFIKKYDKLYKADKKTLYTHYDIPKKTGGYRPIDDPCTELRTAFKEMNNLILEIQSKELYTTAAYAYIEGRSTLDCVRRHEKTNPNLILHMDLKGFFPGITLDFIEEQLRRVNPWASMNPETIRMFFSLCMLNGGLPQGTNTSPRLSNLVMIPFDYALMRYANNHNLTYTRYADDMYFSSLYPINVKEIEGLITEMIAGTKARFTLNKEKTHYGSTKGKSYMLGVLLTKEHGVKYGNQRVRLLKAAVWSFLKDYKAGKIWNRDDVLQLNGTVAWAKQVDPEYINKVVEHLEEKAGVRFETARKAALNI